MTDNNQEEHSFEELFKNLKTAMAEEKGEIFSSRTVVSNVDELKKIINILKENAIEEDKEELEEAIRILEANKNGELDIIINALKENANEEDKNKLDKMISDTLKENATEEDRKKLKLIMEIIGVNIFRYRFTGTDKNGNIEKYEYIFLGDRVIINVFDANNNLLNKSSNEFEYKNYSHILFYDIIKGLSEDGENSIFFKKNCYNSSIANIILRYYDKNDEFIDNQGSNFQTAVIEYIQKNNNLTYSNALMKALAEAGIGAGEFNGINYCRNNEGKIDDIENIAESAIIGGNGDLIHIIEDHISKGENLELITKDNLKAACGRDDPAILNYLINNCNGIENILKDDNNVKELFEKIYHPEVAKEVFNLIKNLVNLIKDEENNTEKEEFLILVFTNIVKNGNLWVMQFIFDKVSKEIFNGDKERIKNFMKNNSTYILWAAIENSNKNNEEIVNFLLKQDGVVINKDIFSGTPITFAIYKKNIDVIKLLLEKDKSLSKESEKIDLVSKINILTNYNEAIYKQCPMNKKEMSTLNYAVMEGDLEIVKLLFNHINLEKITEQGKNELIYSLIIKEDPEMFNFLLEYFSKKDLNMCFNIVDRYGDNEFVKENFKMYENLKDNNGRNLLHYAVSKRNFRVVDFLLQNTKLDINLKDNEGKTPFDYAIENKDFKIFELLIQNQSINISNENVNKIINFVIEENKPKIFNFLLQKPNINILDEDGDKIINFAIKNKNLEIISMYFNTKIFDIMEKKESIEEKDRKIEKLKNILNNVREKYNLKIKETFANEEKFEKDLVYMTVDIENFLNDKKTRKYLIGR